MDITELRKHIKYGEFDYNVLSNLLKDYQNPRQKITSFLANEQILRVKKGLYVFTPAVGGSAYSLEILANLIYGPSYISKQYALALYGLIPERVYELTCITNKRNKRFVTPVGVFSYSYLHPCKYSIGISQYKIDSQRYVLVATKEKALADLLWRESALNTKELLYEYLVENLRIEEQNIAALEKTHLAEMADLFDSKPITLLKQLVEQLS